ncbi:MULTISPECIES: hypothetical protein [Hungatella]|nr:MULTISPECIES: hypothetical protein [Hungatella]
MFVLAGAALIGTSLFWITGMKRVERYAAESGKWRKCPLVRLAVRQKLP